MSQETELNWKCKETKLFNYNLNLTEQRRSRMI